MEKDVKDNTLILLKKPLTRHSFLQVSDFNVLPLSLELPALCQGTAVVFMNLEQVRREQKCNSMELNLHQKFEEGDK